MKIEDYKKLGPVDDLVWLIEKAKLPRPVREYKFCRDRNWRADLAWPARMILLEVEGGRWTRGRHTRAEGFLDDMMKYNRATLMGYQVLRVTPEMIKDGLALALVKEMFA